MDSRKFSFYVKGMTCASCVRNVERNIQKIDGVEFVAVNLATEKGFVIVNPDIGFRELKKTVEKVGYELVESNESEIDILTKKLHTMRKDFVNALIIGAPITVLMIIHMFFYRIPYYEYFEFIFGTLSLLFPGRRILKSALIAGAHFHTNMDSLISLGVIVSYITNILHILGIHIISFGFLVPMLIVLHLLGRYIETFLKDKSIKELKSLMEMKKDTVKIIKDEKRIEVPLDTVKKGDIVVVELGSYIQLDGRIINGNAYFDESMITGEPVPVFKQEGDKIVSGSRCLNNEILAEVEVTGKDTFLNRMIEIINQAQSPKFPIQAIADRITNYFIPVIMLLSILSFLSWNLFPDIMTGIFSFVGYYLPWVPKDSTIMSMAIYSLVSVLVIACPCALGLSIPIALFIGSSTAAKNGLIIKDGEGIQSAEKIDTIVFDKTGTLTTGRLNIVENFIKEEDLRKVISLEKKSSHPIARSIVNTLEKHSNDILEFDEIKEIAGSGIYGKIGDDTYFIGKPKDFSNYEKFMENGFTIVEYRQNEIVEGYLVLGDTLKHNAKNVIDNLKNIGIEVYMFTGDNKKSAQYFGNLLGIDNIFGNLKPEDKLNLLHKLQIDGRKVAMVGDGINDAAVLKSANVSFAIGNGSDLAIENGDIVIIDGDLEKILFALKLSKKIFGIIKQNLFWAFFYNIVAIPLAFIGALHPLIAEVAMSFSSINVILNSLRIKKGE